MSSQDVYGRLLAAPTLERGAEVTIRLWLGAYLGEVLAQAGYARDALPDPSDMVRVVDFDWPKSTGLALVVLASPGTSGDAVREPEGYRASWDLRASVLCDLGDRLDTREAAEFYAAALGAALSHQGIAAVQADGVTAVRNPDGSVAELEGSSVRWAGETIRALGARDERALIAGEARVLVTVEAARSVYGGPLVPPVPPADRDPATADVPTPVNPTVTLTREHGDLT